MGFDSKKKQISVAVAAAMGVMALAVMTAAPQASAAKVPGKYVAGDFHNHTTCSDGTISMQKLVNKATAVWGLDWFVQAGHGGNGNRNCTLVEDASLDNSPAYPFVSGYTPNTNWQGSPTPINPKGTVSGVSPKQNMWRWQSLQEVQYQMVEYLNINKNVPLFLGMESVVPGHEHASMSVIDGQLGTTPLNLPGYTALGTNPTTAYVAKGNATALAKWSYCFDRGDTDTSRGNTFASGAGASYTNSGIGNNWDCSVAGSANAADVSWNPDAQKLMPASGTGNGTKGHAKTVEAMKWMAQNAPTTSYYVPAHAERAGPFFADGNQGFNVESLRDFNNAAPTVAFGIESQPGHGASANRGEYQIKRQVIAGVATDSVGGTAYGGTGVYGSYVGGVWDALLGEGRNFWFFASSDWHNRGSFGADDRRTTQDFQPGEYQRNYTMVRNGIAATKLTPQMIVDGLRTGNVFTSSGQLIDRLAFVACSSTPSGLGFRSNVLVENLALNAAVNGTDTDVSGCATMGEKLVVRPGMDIVVAVALRDPAGTNNAPYTFANPSLAQNGVTLPINAPVLDHVDLIGGRVTGYKTPGAADYSGAWPVNAAWLDANGNIAGLGAVPAAAKNTSTSILKTWSATTPWTTATSSVDQTQYLKMSVRIPAVQASQYVRLRGTNLPPSTPFETDASGNPLPDLFTNANDTTKLMIPCDVVPSVTPPAVLTNGLTIDGCPSHLATATAPSPIAGHKAVSFDVAAWSDLWFYANPIYIQVNGSVAIAGVK